MRILFLTVIIALLASCAPQAATLPSAPIADTATNQPAAPTTTLTATDTLVPPSPTESPTASPTDTSTPLPIVDSLKATVTADLLSCRYGPGPFYLFLYGLRKGANIVLVGRTDGNNWVWVQGKNPCWVNTTYISINGDPHSLPIVYPGQAKLPKSPYYPPTTVTKVVRNGNQVTVMWLDIPLRAGDEEDARMQHYIIEAWRCENGQFIFDPLATNDTSITFTDEPGCSQPSHGNVWVQEKHGLAGPAEIPWPPYNK